MMIYETLGAIKHPAGQLINRKALKVLSYQQHTIKLESMQKITEKWCVFFIFCRRSREKLIQFDSANDPRTGRKKGLVCSHNGTPICRSKMSYWYYHTVLGFFFRRRPFFSAGWIIRNRGQHTGQGRDSKNGSPRWRFLCFMYVLSFDFFLCRHISCRYRYIGKSSKNGSSWTSSTVFLPVCVPVHARAPKSDKRFG